MDKTTLFIYRRGELSSRAAALDAAGRFCGSFCFEPPTDIFYDERGKPFFSGREDIFLSLSHSGDYVVAAVSGVPVGVDLQLHRECGKDAIARRFFHSCEIDFLKADPSRFFDVWAAKESYVKYTGEGIAASFRSFSTVDSDGFKRVIDNAFFDIIDFETGYSLALTTKIKTKVSIKTIL